MGSTPTTPTHRNVAYWEGAWFGTKSESAVSSILTIPTILRREHDGDAAACKAVTTGFDSQAALHWQVM